MRRDRERTKGKLLDAVDVILATEGVRALGINAIARVAGVDKVLIYRYFGDLAGLIDAYIEHGDLWWTVDEILGDDVMPPAEATLAGWCALALARQIRALRNRPVTLQLLAWELIEPNQLTQALTDLREERHRALVRRILARAGAGAANTRLLAVHALLGAASTYVVLRAEKQARWLDVDFDDPRGWERLDAVNAGIVRAVLETHEL